MPAANPPTIFSAPGSLTFFPAPGDRDIFIGISPTVPGNPSGLAVASGSTAPAATAAQTYGGLAFAVQGTRASGIAYDIAMFTTDFAGPLVGPINPTNAASVAYLGSCQAFTKIVFNISALTLGAATIEILSGYLFDTPVGRMVGVGGAVGISGSVNTNLQGLLNGTPTSLPLVNNSQQNPFPSPVLPIATTMEERINQIENRIVQKLDSGLELLTRWVGHLPKAAVIEDDPATRV